MDSYDSEYMIQFMPDLANELCWGCDRRLDDYGYCAHCDGY